MAKLQEEGERVQQPDRFPETTSDTVARGIEFTVAMSSEGTEENSEAPMLDALTTYRNEQLN